MIYHHTWDHPALRWVCTLGWTALTLITLLQSSSNPVIGPPAPPGDPPLEREILLTIGHIVAFGVLTTLWWWALSTHWNTRHALICAVVIALTIGTLSEIAQASVPDRAASWFDLGINWLVTLAAAWRIQRSAP